MRPKLPDTVSPREGPDILPALSPSQGAVPLLPKPSGGFRALEPQIPDPEALETGRGQEDKQAALDGRCHHGRHHGFHLAA